MLNRDNIIFVVLNPSLICLERILDFISAYDNVRSKLHILNDLEDHEEEQEDLLILELSISKKISTQLLAFINNSFPTLNTYIFNKPKKSASCRSRQIRHKNIERNFPLNSHSFNLN